MDYTPHTAADVTSMLKEIGVGSVEDLFSCIPPHLRAAKMNLPGGVTEFEVIREMEAAATENTGASMLSFCGGGFYDHVIPSTVDYVLRRGEFFTAYTPYQPEASQGTLQAMYEFQSCICNLTGMEAANASLYDGGSAIFEAMMMAIRITKRRRFVVDGAINPIYLRMIRTYTSTLDVRLEVVPPTESGSDTNGIGEKLDEETAAVVLCNPDFFGSVRDLTGLIEAAHAKGALSVVSVYPLSLGILKSPGEMGADIVTGEGQSLGLPLALGGPYVGFMATRKKFIRQMPGRIVGATTDAAGKRGFVLTLQTREQHIRREKATSNICSNEGLCALACCVYMATVGPEGLREAASLCAANARYAMKKISGIDGVSITSGPYVFNEFACKLPVPASEAAKEMMKRRIIPGIPLGPYFPELSAGENMLLVAVTEKHTLEEIDLFVRTMEEAIDELR